MPFPKPNFLSVGSVLFAALAALPASPAQAQTAMTEDCTQVVDAVWLDAYAVEAATQGDCGLGEISLTIFNQAGEIEFADTYGPDDLFGFYDIVTFDGMQVAPTDLVTSYAQEGSSAKLPPWTEGAEGPQAGEFRFYVEQGSVRTSRKRFGRKIARWSVSFRAPKASSAFSRTRKTVPWKPLAFRPSQAGRPSA